MWGWQHAEEDDVRGVRGLMLRIGSIVVVETPERFLTPFVWVSLSDLG